MTQGQRSRPKPLTVTSLWVNRGVQGSEAIDLKDLQNRIENLSNGLEKMSKMSDEGLIKLAEAANAAATVADRKLSYPQVHGSVK